MSTMIKAAATDELYKLRDDAVADLESLYKERDQLNAEGSGIPSGLSRQLQEIDEFLLAIDQEIEDRQRARR